MQTLWNSDDQACEDTVQLHDLEEQPLVIGAVLFLTTGFVSSLVDTELSN